MPYIIKNGKTYTGNSVTLTQAQYNALSDAEKNNGITYYIYDSDAVLDASDVGLGEGNVEDLAGSVAVIETSPATAIHAVGDFILWNGQLYTVTSAIAVGETLTVGTNITAKTVGGELTTLKNGLTEWTSPRTLSSLTDFTDWVDTKIETRGILFGYLAVGNAAAVGLTSVGHVYQAMANSANFRCIVAYAVNNAYIAMITKQNGTWGTVWKKATLS